MKQRFVIPVTWSMTAEVVAYADSLENAVAQVEDNPNLPNGDYMDGSFEVNHDFLPYLNKMQKIK